MLNETVFGSLSKSWTKNFIYQLRGFSGALGMSLAFISRIEEEAMLLSVFHVHFSLSLSWFQPIFVSFVAISTALCPYFKAMLLGQNLPQQGFS